ncbi:MAG TPA: hypothetical protein VLI41_00260 [Phenylobacterium sp.]|uniref:type I pantothenate kinase n=1 Tax=Phenylobacterium sp. TaxID=1871053 RepID=UPI002B7A5F40|nr:hypothetical protein [Phenylobacterium sp.]HSV01609.1 hypothetical protein [Phenylobacterium sp.]
MPSLDDIAELIAARRTGRGPLVVGVTGSVAVGKTTFAAALAKRLMRPPGATSVALVCTDGFLFDNATLEARGLTLRKGFPESYDAEALALTLAGLRRRATLVPAYSHVTYDIDPALAREIAPPEVLIVEGLGLHDPKAVGLDLLIYLEAEEADLEAWFTARFLALWRAAEHDPASFYARFRQMGEAETRAFAGDVWRIINLPNLRDHIGPARERADLVVRKGSDHRIEAVACRYDASRSSSSAGMSSLV